jgi:hypothetical protein
MGFQPMKTSAGCRCHRDTWVGCPCYGEMRLSYVQEDPMGCDRLRRRRSAENNSRRHRQSRQCRAVGGLRHRRQSQRRGGEAVQGYACGEFGRVVGHGYRRRVRRDTGVPALRPSQGVRRSRQARSLREAPGDDRRSSRRDDRIVRPPRHQARLRVHDAVCRPAPAGAEVDSAGPARPAGLRAGATVLLVSAHRERLAPGPRHRRGRLFDGHGRALYRPAGDVLRKGRQGVLPDRQHDSQLPLRG